MTTPTHSAPHRPYPPSPTAWQVDELLRDDARDSGCSLDGTVVWSGTPCGHAQHSYFVAYGSSRGDLLNGHQAGTLGRRCAAAIGPGRQAHPVRCCANVEGTGCAPSPEPSMPPSSKPTARPTPAPTWSPPTPAPTHAPTVLPLTCASPSALYESLTQAPGEGSGGYTCSQLEVSEAGAGLKERLCGFSPNECEPSDMWETCTFKVRSSDLTVFAPPSYKFDRPPEVLFCMNGCKECLAK